MEAPASSVPTTTYPELRLGRYRFIFRALTPIGFPTFSGSAWRGTFGSALKATVCVTRLKDCETCLLYRSCSFPYIFETPTPPDSEKMRRYPTVPRPFVLEPERLSSQDLAEGERFHLQVTLIGPANAHLPYVIYAFQRAGSFGIGRGRGTFSLEEVEQESAAGSGDWQQIFTKDGRLTPLKRTEPDLGEIPERVRIRFITPLRLKEDGDLVGAEAFEFHHLLRNVLRRMSMLTYFHSDTPLETDFRALVQRAREVGLARKDLRWHDWTRFSSRQDTTMQMGGLVGDVEVDGADVEVFWPFLALGQWVHGGKGATMGLGHYRLESATSLPVEQEAHAPPRMHASERETPGLAKHAR